MFSSNITCNRRKITIGKGSGIVWEGMPFNVNLQGAMVNPNLYPQYGMLSISESNSVCMMERSLSMIGGYMALPLKNVQVNIQASGLFPEQEGQPLTCFARVSMRF